MNNDIPEPPAHFSFSNGAFCGYTLVSREPVEAPKMGMAKRVEDWLPQSIDLRPINAIKQYGFEPNAAKCTSLYANGNFVACINAHYDAVQAEWLKWRSVYDEKKLES